MTRSARQESGAAASWLRSKGMLARARRESRRDGFRSSQPLSCSRSLVHRARRFAVEHKRGVHQGADQGHAPWG